MSTEQAALVETFPVGTFEVTLTGQRIARRQVNNIYAGGRRCCRHASAGASSGSTKPAAMLSSGAWLR
jgi:hypothetical protein